MNESVMIVVVISAVIILLLLMLIGLLISRYKICPVNKILVIYGQTKGTETGTAKCVHGGGAFVWPVIQQHKFLDLEPFTLDIKLAGALSKQNIRVAVPSRFTISISSEPGIMQNAAVRLLDANREKINDLAEDVIFGQLRAIIATMDIEEINTDRDKFTELVNQQVESELKKFGLKLHNVNIRDITDDAGYIEALGKKSSAEAVNAAKIDVAVANKDGEIGTVKAKEAQNITVANTEAQIKIGENIAAQKALESDVALQIAQKEAVAATEKANIIALQATEKEMRELEALRKESIIIVQAEADKKAQLIAAQAVAESLIIKANTEAKEVEILAKAKAEARKIEAQAEAEATFAGMKAQAEGLYELYDKQAEGFKNLISAAGSTNEAINLMLTEKATELYTIKTDAIKNIKIDKNVVFSGNNNDENQGIPSIINGLMKSVPLMNEFYDSNELTIPSILGKNKEKEIISEKVEVCNNNNVK